MLLFFSNPVLSQCNDIYFGKTYTVGLSYSRLWGLESENPIGFTYVENIFSADMSMRLSKKFWAGITVKQILTKESTFWDSKYEIYDFFGIFIQYDFVFNKGNRFYIENSLNISDYCVCNTTTIQSVPYKKNGLYYLGGSLGYEYNINRKKGRNLFLEAGISANYILNKVDYKDNFIYYFLGVNYRLGLLK